MGLRLKVFPSLFKVPSCTQQPKTESFRVTATKDDDIFKTINSVSFEPESDTVETPHSWFTYVSESETVSTTEYDDSSTSICGDSHLEAIVREAQQSSSTENRIFFDPTKEDSPMLGPILIIEKSVGSDVSNLISYQNTTIPPFKESVALSIETQYPYDDFKRSMEQMVDSLGVRDDWEGLEDLLGWYLQVNARDHHEHIISAFVDLVDEILVSNTSRDPYQHADSYDENGLIARSSTYYSSATSCLSSCGSISDHMRC